MGAALEGRIGVVFVNFHSEHLLVDRARMFAAEAFEVVVADNSGTFPSSVATVVAMDGNQGFGAACNRGALALPADVRVVCFHNPDVDASPEVIRSLRLVLQAQARPGVVAPAERVGQLVRNRGYHYPSPGRDGAVSVRRAAQWRMAAKGAPREPSGPPQPVAVRVRGGRGRRFGGGGLLVVSRDAHQAIGGFDEQYFLYAEDLDYWHRLVGAGLSAEFAPNLVIDHASGTGSPLDGVQREVLRWVGVELFAEKTGADWRRYRRFHQPLLRVLPSPAPAMVRHVRACWDAGDSPSDTSDCIRSLSQHAGAR